MSTIANLVQRDARLRRRSRSAPLNATSLRDQAYALLKNAIAETDIYDPKQELRLDERQLTAALGVSRTPIREALSLLEQEGFIRTMPRRGIYIVRKSKREMIEMIQMWAALESMAARLATLHASDADIAALRHLFDEFQNSPPSAASGRVLGREHRLSHRGHRARRVADHRRCDAQPADPCARDPPRDDHAERPRGALDHRSSEDHRSARAARHRTRPSASRASTRSISRRTSTATAIFSADRAALPSAQDRSRARRESARAARPPRRRRRSNTAARSMPQPAARARAAQPPAAPAAVSGILRSPPRSASGSFEHRYAALRCAGRSARSPGRRN